MIETKHDETTVTASATTTPTATNPEGATATVTATVPDPITQVEQGAATLLLSPTFWPMVGGLLLDAAAYLGGKVDGNTALISAIVILAGFMGTRTLENHSKAITGQK